jgi:hypothetical protein
MHKKMCGTTSAKDSVLMFKTRDLAKACKVADLNIFRVATN